MQILVVDDNMTIDHLRSKNILKKIDIDAYLKRIEEINIGREEEEAVEATSEEATPIPHKLPTMVEFGKETL